MDRPKVNRRNERFIEAWLASSDVSRRELWVNSGREAIGIHDAMQKLRRKRCDRLTDRYSRLSPITANLSAIPDRSIERNDD
jgi:hypothetical protein